MTAIGGVGYFYYQRVEEQKAEQKRLAARADAAYAADPDNFLRPPEVFDKPPQPQPRKEED
ncbi:hypothetical protein [Candidatus Mycobacterium methanotrophicum]|uniref:Uncharacterized protein n=1 Tax=Candidatus Mycobacterium methanotrophicum TaxID=2943498 RepID=A0ABY4QRR9_9MYCO|nr:hypothetical protein [Candidatus Mycobacterium methanotrophicum]UQX13361.1 hypothetical protein M5I08_15020 [Candidatus Mycobacterium methanotrophicum]